MASEEINSIEELVKYFSEYDEEENIRNNIEAINLNFITNNQGGSLNSELKKKYSSKPKIYKRVKVGKSTNSFSILSKFPNEYPFDDQIISKKLNISYPTIQDNYFLEESHVVSEKLQSHIDYMSALYSNYYKVLISRTNEESTTPIYIVGRIFICEEAGIETISIENRGKVRLDIDNITEYALFPGQIVMVKGTSDTYTFIVSEIITELFKPSPTLPESQFLVGLVSGPFSTVDLDYSIFIAFLDKICTEVNALIIIGPIVDNDNEIIQEGIINIESLDIKNGSYEDIFNNIQGHLIKLKEEESCEIIYVPHTREIQHIFPLPMPGLNYTFETKYKLSTDSPEKSLYYPPSPAKISIDGTRIHVVPYDFIHEIIQPAVLKSQKLINKISMSLLQTMNQHSYLPIMPNSLPVEYSKYEHFIFEQPPHILIVQSKFPVQFESVPGILCVKSTSFAEGNKIGNYSIINVAGGGRSVNECIGVKNYRINS
ncbi:hypothetical protein SteCoe_27835 [Stentor coeruleus]|uniref:DNA polymerase alpha subunit B n=1 Tax=Stentor coeruleus TaxID=5963 RepID=A0A1R2B9M4_9CILI|nr:hypothetical protein SteCoe_27835 [Stentor coeruleus]